MDIEEGVTVDLDEKGHIVGIEILDASEKLELSNLVNISIENLPPRKGNRFFAGFLRNCYSTDFARSESTSFIASPIAT